MTAPPWLDPQLYPFEHRYIDVEGGRLHYVDEGEGPVVLLVHGTPTWSLLFRRLIRALSRDHRVIAPDHIGFGLSAKPRAWSGRPADHQRNLIALVDRLGLEDVTLTMHDFGGPIGPAGGPRNRARRRRPLLDGGGARRRRTGSPAVPRRSAAGRKQARGCRTAALSPLRETLSIHSYATRLYHELRSRFSRSGNSHERLPPPDPQGPQPWPACASLDAVTTAAI